jgi:hypothetical protein
MGWNPFGSKTSEEAVGVAPTRADRERCWERRDVYFACLDRAGVLVPGKEGEQCRTERDGFEANCVKSWVGVCLLCPCFGMLMLTLIRLTTLKEDESQTNSKKSGRC